ncbi:hypothetical protein BBF96_10330 [Anoxybacter fermentans]|uniref:ABC transporter permease n=1 Tax=Anoxybacter fermentans TaxID=1323375 RepID=A0A3Q9HQY5_9FIRM|nr:ABC-2 family transporter protein [Anoxybacter fermentans]AZR73746.1 hypothetical protein BBF96_10330 [Anoxybacter fermentans]
MQYIRLYWCFLKNNLTRDIYFKENFLVTLGEGLLFFLINLTLYNAIFANVNAIGDWNKFQVIVLIATNQIFTGLFYGLFANNLPGLQHYVNKGDLDYILLKPISTQFYISTRYINFGHILSSFAALPLLFHALKQLNIHPGFFDYAVYIILLINGLLLGYALLLIFMSVVIWTIKVEGLYFIIMEIISYGKYPASVFKGGIKFIFSFVIPIIIIINYPAQILIEGIKVKYVFISVVLTILLFGVSKWFWNLALRFYTSASS